MTTLFQHQSLEEQLQNNLSQLDRNLRVLRVLYPMLGALQLIRLVQLLMQ